MTQNFSYTHEAKLISERVYDDPGSYEYLELAPEDVVTPAMAKEALAPHLERAVHLFETDDWDGARMAR